MFSPSNEYVNSDVNMIGIGLSTFFGDIVAKCLAIAISG
jgi:hypothetical protein